MNLKVIDSEFCVCQIPTIFDVNFNDEFCFVAKTDDELSLVCSLDFVPQNTIKREDGWVAFKIEGILDFSFVGILSKLSTILANEHISIFAISTYNTDYVLIKRTDLNNAITVLKHNGYVFVS